MIRLLNKVQISDDQHANCDYEFFLEGSNNKLYHHNSRYEQNITLIQLHKKNIPPVETRGINQN